MEQVPSVSGRRAVLKSIGAAAFSAGILGKVAASNGPENASLQGQLKAVEGVTKKFEGRSGLQKARDEGFEFAPKYKGSWPLFKTDRIRDGELCLTEPDVLEYVLDDGGEPVLAGVGFSIPTSDHPSQPDIFDDEGEDLVVSESNGWLQPPEIQYLFSNGDETVQTESQLSLSELLTPENWRFARDEDLEPGDEFDVDRDGTQERLDLAKTVPTHWALRVWVHVDNPNGLFATQAPEI